ncbi:MAG TPA: GNAT family protein [Bacillota bacterium]|nr:GNAT family protein [Bacillota bacterium]HOG53314.1 GNAT family protein [Bacillota bacterium]
MLQFAPITTDRLTIRLLEEKDAEVFFRYRTMPEIYEYQSWVPESLESIRKFTIANATAPSFQPGVYTQLAIIKRQDGSLIGDMAVILKDDGAQAEIGFSLIPENQGKGYAAEAVTAIISHLFYEIGLHRIFASVDPDNKKSIKLIERLGFRLEAHFKKSYLMRGSWYDDCIYGMLAEEWKARHDVATKD